jgi:putative thioredoxin
MEQSATVPVVVDFWGEGCEPCKVLTPILETVVNEYGGRLLLAKIDIGQNPEIAAAFRVQSVPTVTALVEGQPVPLFVGAIPASQVRQFFDKLLEAAATVGVTGRVSPVAAAVPPPPPPLHQEGYDALDRGDLVAAKAAFSKALAESPADQVAKAALAQVELQERLEAGAEAAARADQPDASLDDIMAAADSAVAVGEFAVGFGRILEALRTATPDEKDRLRLRLLDLFEVAGPDDPAVGQARRRLASLLF